MNGVGQQPHDIVRVVIPRGGTIPACMQREGGQTAGYIEDALLPLRFLRPSMHKSRDNRIAREVLDRRLAVNGIELEVVGQTSTGRSESPRGAYVGHEERTTSLGWEVGYDGFGFRLSRLVANLSDSLRVSGGEGLLGFSEAGNEFLTVVGHVIPNATSSPGCSGRSRTQLSELGRRLINVLVGDRDRFLPGVHVGYLSVDNTRLPGCTESANRTTVISTKPTAIAPPWYERSRRTRSFGQLSAAQRYTPDAVLPNGSQAATRSAWKNLNTFFRTEWRSWRRCCVSGTIDQSNSC